MKTIDESFWRKRQTTIQKEGDFFTSLVDHKIVLDWILFVIITCLSLYPGCLLNCLAFLLFSWRAKSMSIEISWTRSPCWGGGRRWESRGAEQEEQEEGIHDVWWWSGQVQGGDHQVVDVRLNLMLYTLNSKLKMKSGAFEEVMTFAKNRSDHKNFRKKNFCVKSS